MKPIRYVKIEYAPREQRFVFWVSDCGFGDPNWQTGSYTTAATMEVVENLYSPSKYKLIYTTS